MSTFDLLIRGGRVATAGGDPVALDVGIRDGTIVALGRLEPGEARRVVGAEGLLVLPGVIDLHTHLRSTRPEPDLFWNETASAVAGGVTMVGDFAYPPGTPYELDFEAKLRRLEAEAACDFCLHTVVKSAADLERATTRTIKVFFTASGAGGQTEDALGFLAQAVAEGRQVLAHVEALDDYLAVMRHMTNTSDPGRVHILHVPHQRFVSLRRGFGAARLTMETCPHYLMWEAVRDVDGCDVNPAVVACDLWPELRSGGIDTIGTDHCSYSREEKGEYGLPGFPGLESALRLIFTYGVQAGRVSWSDLCRLMSTGPARILDLYPRKGAVQVGSDADLVLFDPGYEDVWSGPSYGRGDFSPYAGLRLAGRVERTLVRGREVYAQGVVDGETRGWGAWQLMPPFPLPSPRGEGRGCPPKAGGGGERYGPCLFSK